MVYHSVSCHSVSCYITVCHVTSQCVTIHHGVPQYITVCHVTSQRVMLHHSVIRYITVCHSTSQRVTMYDEVCTFTDRSVLCSSCNEFCTGAKSSTKGDTPVGMTSIVLDTPTVGNSSVAFVHRAAKDHSALLMAKSSHAYQNALLSESIFKDRCRHFHYN